MVLLIACSRCACYTEDIGLFLNPPMDVPNALRTRNMYGDIEDRKGIALPPQAEALCSQKFVQFFAGVKLPGAFGHHVGPTLIACVHSL